MCGTMQLTSFANSSPKKVTLVLKNPFQWYNASFINLFAHHSNLSHMWFSFKSSLPWIIWQQYFFMFYDTSGENTPSCVGFFDWLWYTWWMATDSQWVGKISGLIVTNRNLAVFLESPRLLVLPMWLKLFLCNWLFFNLCPKEKWIWVTFQKPNVENHNYIQSPGVIIFSFRIYWSSQGFVDQFSNLIYNPGTLYNSPECSTLDAGKSDWKGKLRFKL